MPGPGVGLGAAAALLLTAPAIGTVLLLGPGSPAAAAGASSCGLAGAGSHLFTGEQLTEQMWTDASSIVQTTALAGLPPRAAVIAVATSLQEARLLPITHGDLAGPDSLGMYQQRNSWGPASVRLDPAGATTLFLARLVTVPAWQHLPLTRAAQAVQSSAAGGAYAAWEGDATRIVKTLQGTASPCTPTAGDGLPATGSTALPAGFALPAGTSLPATRAVSFALAQLGKPYGFGSTGPLSWDCSSLTQHAWAAAGVALPRTTYAQVGAGTPVYDPRSLLPGDLVFIAGSDGSTTSPGHVGMYLGGGLLIDAPHTGAVVHILPLSSYGALSSMRHLA